MKFKIEETNYKIEVKNRSRLKLVGATLEYYIIIEHGVVKGRLPTESMEEVEWWFYPYFQIGNRNRGDGEKMMGKKTISLANGKAQIKDLVFNFTTEITTEPVPIREIAYTKNSKQKFKDAILGVIVRITDENGNELSVGHSSGYKFPKKSWDEISKMPPGDPSGFPPQMRNN